MHERFTYRNKEELLLKAIELVLDLPFSDDLTPLTESLSIKGFMVTNRMVIQPMEGHNSEYEGSPSDLTQRRDLKTAALSK